MTSILEDPKWSAASRSHGEPRRFTRDEYYKMAEVGILDEDERVELIEGVIHRMSPASSLHASIVKKLNHYFQHWINSRELIVSVQDPIWLDQDSELETDLVILKYRADYYQSSHPRPKDIIIVCEVMVTSEKYDREIKLPLYAKHGIQEVWLFDAAKRIVEQYSNPEDSSYQQLSQLKPGDSLESARLADFKLDIRQLFTPMETSE